MGRRKQKFKENTVLLLARPRIESKSRSNCSYTRSKEFPFMMKLKPQVVSSQFEGVGGRAQRRRSQEQVVHEKSRDVWANGE
jgi:hypothetical protein